MEKLLEEFDRVTEWLSKSKETAPVSTVAELMAITVRKYFDATRKQNPALEDVYNDAEMSIVISLIMNLYSLTSKGDDAMRIYKECGGKPN